MYGDGYMDWIRSVFDFHGTYYINLPKAYTRSLHIGKGTVMRIVLLQDDSLRIERVAEVKK